MLHLGQHYRNNDFHVETLLNNVLVQGMPSISLHFKRQRLREMWSSLVNPFTLLL